MMTPKQVSEWDPILTPALTEYGWVRQNGNMLEIKLASFPTYTINVDAKAIPQLIKILQRLETTL